MYFQIRCRFAVDCSDKCPEAYIKKITSENTENLPQSNWPEE